MAKAPSKLVYADFQGADMYVPYTAIIKYSMELPFRFPIADSERIYGTTTIK